MSSRIIKRFYMSAALLLFLTAAAKLYSVTGHAKILAVSDDFLHVNNRLLMTVMGVIEAAIAAYLLWGGALLMRARALFWLSGNFIIYRLETYTLGIKYCPCLGTLGQKLPLSQPHLEMVLTALVLYWFLGSSYILFRAWDGREKARLAQLAAGAG
jgi:hypothetical protein